MDVKLPSLYKKRDNNYYFTYKGRQYYAGSTIEAANRKMMMRVQEAGAAGNYSIQESTAEYLASIEGVQSPDSVVSKRRCYSRVFRQLTEIRTIFDISTEALVRYRVKLLKSHKKQYINGTFIQLSAFLQHIVNKGILLQNPVRKMPKLKVFVDPSPDFLNEDEKRRLLEYCEESKHHYIRKRDKLVFTLILNTGLRRIEVAQLKWSDIDLEKRVLVVRSGKGGRHRVIAINDTLYEMLVAFPRRGESVITTIDGHAITRNALSSIALKYLGRLHHQYKGRKRLSLHSLRASFATTLCERGVSTRIVQSLLGHADPRTTMRYAAVSEAALVDAVGRLG